MLSDEEKKEYEELKRLLYQGTLTQYGKRKLIEIIEKQSKEIKELKENNKTLKNLQNDTNRLYIEMTERKNYFERELQKLEDKIKAKIEELDEVLKGQLIEKIRVYFEAQKEVLQSLLEKE